MNEKKINGILGKLSRICETRIDEAEVVSTELKNFASLGKDNVKYYVTGIRRDNGTTVRVSKISSVKVGEKSLDTEEGYMYTPCQIIDGSTLNSVLCACEKETMKQGTFYVVSETYMDSDMVGSMWVNKRKLFLSRSNAVQEAITVKKDETKTHVTVKVTKVVNNGGKNSKPKVMKRKDDENKTDSKAVTANTYSTLTYGWELTLMEMDESIPSSVFV